MPIKKENKDKYPEDWPEIRERIRRRAGNQCEGCGIHNHSVGYRTETGRFVPCSGNLLMEDYGNGIDPKTGKLLDVKRAREIAEFLTETDELGNKYFVIICTVAHLDHDPRNCSDNNLRFWCQKCHNSYDRPHRDKTIREERMRGQLALDFDGKNEEKKELLNAWGSFTADHPEFADLEKYMFDDL